MKTYVLDDLSIVKASHPMKPWASRVQCLLPKELIGKEIKIIDVDEIISQASYVKDVNGDAILIPALDENGDPIFDQPTDLDGNPIGVPVQRMVPDYILDENGDPVMEDVVTGTHKEAVLDEVAEDQRLRDVEAEEMEKAFDPLYNMDIVEALIQKAEGNPLRFNRILTARKYRKFRDYRRSKMKKDGVQNMVVVNDGVFSIEQHPIGTKPSNFVRMAPPGFKVGDADCLIHKGGKQFEIDIAKRLARFKTRDVSAEDTRRSDEWNSSSPLERLKGAIIG